MTRTTARLAFLLTALAFAGQACADARAELRTAYGKFIEASSFRAQMTDLKTGKTANQIEFVAPDRFAITIQGGLRQVIIGNTMYMDIGGRRMSMPLPESINPRQYRNQQALDDLAKDIVVDRLDDASDAGEPARVYHFVSDGEHGRSDNKTWVSKASGLPIQIQTSGDGDTPFRYQIRYSDFNDPGIVIEKPAD